MRQYRLMGNITHNNGQLLWCHPMTYVKFWILLHHGHNFTNRVTNYQWQTPWVKISKELQCWLCSDWELGRDWRCLEGCANPLWDRIWGRLLQLICQDGHFKAQAGRRKKLFSTLLRGDRQLKYGCFFWKKSKRPWPPLPFLEITLRFFFQNLRPNYTALKPTKSAK